MAFLYQYQNMWMTTSLALLFSLAACSRSGPDYPSTAAVKDEIRAVEQAFNDRAAAEGVMQAFLTFADDSAVIVRRNQVFKGKENIRAYFEAQPFQNVRLQWTPEFIGVAESGDLAYTYGPYQFAAEDSAGNPISSEGIFHTVWKRQRDGSWKFVYD